MERVGQVDLPVGAEHPGERVDGTPESAAEHQPLAPVVDDRHGLSLDRAVAGGEPHGIACRRITGGKNLLRQTDRVAADIGESSTAELLREPDVLRSRQVEIEETVQLANLADGPPCQQIEESPMLGLEREDERLP